jgi:hypothetical protein
MLNLKRAPLLFAVRCDNRARRRTLRNGAKPTGRYLLQCVKKSGRRMAEAS